PCGFVCRDGLCLDNIFVCNNVEECSFGEDELNCFPVFPTYQPPVACEPSFIHLNTSGQSQSFSSPNYPNNYYNNLYCQWIIYVPEDLAILLEFNDFSLENRYDYVRIISENMTDISFTGVNFHSVLSESNELLVVMDTDGSVTYRGFNATVKAVDLSEIFVCGDFEFVLLEQVCDGIIDCADFSDELQSCPCSDDSFQCANGVCIAAAKRCDRENNCLDWSDEQGCWNVTSEKCGSQPFLPAEDRIVGGEDVPPGKWPWIGSITVYGSHYCGAALIDREWALTAAHCLGRIDYIRFGTTDLEFHSSVFYEDVGVAEALPHPDYDYYTLANDIALLRLERPVNYSAFIQPICFGEDFAVGTECVSAGWGRLYEYAQGAAEEALAFVDRAAREGIRAVNGAGFALSFLSDADANPTLVPDAIGLLQAGIGLISDQFSSIAQAAGAARRANVLRATTVSPGHFDRFLDCPSFGAEDLFFGQFAAKEEAWARELEARRQTRAKFPRRDRRSARSHRWAFARPSHQPQQQQPLLHPLPQPAAAVPPAPAPATNRQFGAAPSADRARRRRRGRGGPRS
ncbi:suppressor of tumorigenicity 14 protein homolog, partial [Anneissia japonica]|uniref:suppressor of tumorigenicity 14 protein homolog n=1 Tax=Anneissia japonica TaxID=1529436 RepID=UPI00142591BA